MPSTAIWLIDVLVTEIYSKRRFVRWLMRRTGVGMRPGDGDSEVLRRAGFTQQEIAQLAERGWAVEPVLFRLLYGYEKEPFIPVPERQAGQLGSWAWTLPEEVFPTAVINTLLSESVSSVGLLQILTEQQLRDISGIGQKSRDVILEYLESKKLRLSRPREAPKSRVISVFGRISRLPIEYLAVRTGVHCHQLRGRGIYRVHQLGGIPKARVAAIPQGTLPPSYRLTPGKIDQIEQELKALGLRFAS